MHARMHRYASAHTCRYSCVYGTRIYLQIQTPINICLIQKQTEHNIGEVCINSLGWYDANTVNDNDNNNNNNDDNNNNNNKKGLL